MERSFRGTAPAPEIPRDLEWMNCEAPQSLEALRGQLVILDFWTSC